MSNLVTVCLETVLVSAQDRCTVCTKFTIGLEFVLDRMVVLLRVEVKWMLVLVYLEIVLSLTEDRCTIYRERTIGLEIILDTPDGIPR